MNIRNLLSIIILTMLFPACADAQTVSDKMQPLPGAYSMSDYLPLLAGKRIAIVGNHTSMVGDRHLLDTLLSRNIKVMKVFGPEHGFRGKAADGALIDNTIDPGTGVPVISLYGDHKKPTRDDLQGIDLLVFDIQDVGCRFYTYISTLTYVMEACADNQVPLVVLDRPNPNGFYIDGPVLEKPFSSFVGLHPVPIVYGMTIGEYACMVNGEKWLTGGKPCQLKVIPCQNYTHASLYTLPIPPSPNLPTMNAVYLYPSLCLFEGTVVSVGRGTDTPFEVIGHPDYVIGSYAFTPRSIKGVSDHPLYEGKTCFGTYLRSVPGEIHTEKKLQLFWLLNYYNILGLKDAFFTPYFEKLAGTDLLRKQIQAGENEETIRAGWQPALRKFCSIRAKYLLYPDAL